MIRWFATVGVIVALAALIAAAAGTALEVTVPTGNGASDTTILEAVPSGFGDVDADSVEPPSLAGSQGEVIWVGDAETGDLSQWRVALSGKADAEVVTSRVRSGRYALQLTNWDVDGSHSPGARVSPQGKFGSPPDELLPDDAFYGSWFYIPFAFEGKSNVFQFKQSDITQRDSEGNGTAHTQRMLWKLSLDWDPAAQAYRIEISTRIDQGTGEWRAGQPDTLHVTDAIVPVGEWFHLETRYRWGENGSGRTTVWYNDQLIWDRAASTEASNLECLRWCRDWAVNHYLSDYQGYVAPGDSWLYIDDATITTP